MHITLNAQGMLKSQILTLLSYDAVPILISSQWMQLMAFVWSLNVCRLLSLKGGHGNASKSLFSTPNCMFQIRHAINMIVLTAMTLVSVN